MKIISPDHSGYISEFKAITTRREAVEFAKKLLNMKSDRYKRPEKFINGEINHVECEEGVDGKTSYSIAPVEGIEGQPLGEEQYFKIHGSYNDGPVWFIIDNPLIEITYDNQSGGLSVRKNGHNRTLEEIFKELSLPKGPYTKAVINRLKAD